MAEAIVTSSDGAPCFSITTKEEARNGVPILGALIVSDLSLRPVKKVWSFSLPPSTQLPIHAASCIRYGELPGMATGISPGILISGHFYSVFLNGSPKDPSDPTYGYEGKFCIAATATGGQQVVPITRDMLAWRSEVCPSASPSQ
ncbi:hypothetical protein [Janthinobacterium sp. PC23-8]|uniref:hypothetical protein n=1 Tax=Janthinobacterium sp. PC23-8 TaxID=2012679 RepID=UPI0011405134|nr:hypothetical protein [Janthinobacterium sp. PC23-8]